MKQGKFIVLEGLDRSGKSTVVRHIQSLFGEKSPTTLMSFPDRTTKIGQMINEFLLNKSQLGNEAVHLLFSANRWECMGRLKEELGKGNNIVCDRYWYSGVAYSSAKGLDLEWCMAADRGLLSPDIIIYLSAAPESLSKRAGYGEERFQKLEFQTKVKQSFDRIFEESQAHMKSIVRKIDVGEKDLESVKEEVRALLLKQNILGN